MTEEEIGKTLDGVIDDYISRSGCFDVNLLTGLTVFLATSDGLKLVKPKDFFKPIDLHDGA